MGQMENPWGELGLPRGATKLEVKEANRKLVKEYHPDKHMNANGQQRARAEAKFKSVQEAYTLLTSSERVQVCVLCLLTPAFVRETHHAKHTTLRSVASDPRLGHATEIHTCVLCAHVCVLILVCHASTFLRTPSVLREELYVCANVGADAPRESRFQCHGHRRRQFRFKLACTV